ncbi:hypothetical protein CDAR_67341 [Caerostris darwini]|uniref:Uncharacterized protein n=1 Tax=Caerostris darwini TaxID=1538125 RepID=A0AAV4WDI5_9ARAC|nr:hypothetical protein CDAR_67341 [Caerostris darwini]
MKVETVFSRRRVELQHSSYNTNKTSNNVSILKLLPLAIIGPPKNICSSSLIRSSGEYPDMVINYSVNKSFLITAKSEGKSLQPRSVLTNMADETARFAGSVSPPLPPPLGVGG